jgi:hypothetical protein
MKALYDERDDGITPLREIVKFRRAKRFWGLH